jgi:predicted RNA-binding protein with PUA-like domain
MNYWLMKSEPFKYSWQQFVADKKTCWDGVRNYQARNNLQAMQKGDLAFFYHSNEGKEIVGIVRVTKEAYQDPTTEDTAWVVVDIKPVKALKKFVTLTDIKSDAALSQIQLIKQMRLSVCGITEEEFYRILFLGQTKL